MGRGGYGIPIKAKFSENEIHRSIYSGQGEDLAELVAYILLVNVASRELLNKIEKQSLDKSL